MPITCGEYWVYIKHWDSQVESRKALAKCTLGNLFLDEDGDYTHFCTLTINLKSESFGIRVGGFHTGTEPDLLIDHLNQNLIIGADDAVFIFHIPTQTLVYENTDLVAFQRFFVLYHLGIYDFFLIWAEQSIVATTFAGVEIWEAFMPDEVNDIELFQNYITVKLFEGNDLYLDWGTGQPLDFPA